MGFKGVLGERKGDKEWEKRRGEGLIWVESGRRREWMEGEEKTFRR